MILNSNLFAFYQKRYLTTAQLISKYKEGVGHLVVEGYLNQSMKIA